MKIKVTEEHIQKGQPRRCRLCPISLAVADTCDLKKGTGIRTCKPRVRIVRYIDMGDDFGKSIAMAPLPLVAQTFLEAFDNNYPVGPIEFDLVWLDTKH